MPLSLQITCSHRKIAINRYSHKPYLQNCGKCFPCQLMKRNKSLHRLFCEQAKSYKYHYFIRNNTPKIGRRNNHTVTQTNIIIAMKQ